MEQKEAVFPAQGPTMPTPKPNHGQTRPPLAIGHAVR